MYVLQFDRDDPCTVLVDNQMYVVDHESLVIILFGYSRVMNLCAYQLVMLVSGDRDASL